tara:strand:+ start:56 stop:667 length:612 start_codon:yes stop_codon:yes gene_type:complete
MAVTFTDTNVSNPSGAQGAYPLSLTNGHEGLIADLQAYVSRSYTNESSAVIPYGHAVIIDGSATSGLGAKLPAGASATDILGIAVDSNVFENGASTYTATPSNKTADGRIGYPDKQMVNVLSKGVIFVYTTDAVALGDAVRVYHTDSASAASNGGYKGRFAKDAEAGKSFLITAGARWLSAASAESIALLEIDIPTLTVTADT